jgi:hypothetical protein
MVPFIISDCTQMLYIDDLDFLCVLHILMYPILLVVLMAQYIGHSRNDIKLSTNPTKTHSHVVEFKNTKREQMYNEIDNIPAFNFSMFVVISHIMVFPTFHVCIIYNIIVR